jgi:hypothetical protein
MNVLNLLQMRFNDLQNQVRVYLSKTLKDYNENYGNNTILGQLINVLGSTVQNVLLYIEDGLTEQNKYTVQRKKSIYSLAQLGGYNPSMGKAASCMVKMTIRPNNYNSYSITIPNKTKVVCSKNGMKYNIILPQEAVTFSIADDVQNKFLQIVEGNFESQSFISSGGQLYTQNVLFNSDIDIDFLEVKVNNEIWERKDSLYDMDPIANQYVVKTSLNKGIDILFGNNQYGRALNTGDKIDVTYLLHNGELGNIDTDEDVYFLFQDSIKDTEGESIDGNGIFVIKLTDASSVSGGTYSESAAKVKEMIGYNSRALVLADPKNYKVLLNRFSFVGYNRTWSDEGSLIVNSIILKNYKQMLERGSDYFNLQESDLFLTDSQKTSLKNYIANSGQQLAGVTYKISDPEICKYAAYVYLKMKDVQYDKPSVEQSIRDAVGDFFMNIQNDMFIPKSDLVSVIKKASDAIDGVDLYFLGEKNEKAIIDKHYINKTYSYNPSKGNYDIKEEMVYVEDGVNPGIGFDEYGNIYLDNNDQFPVLMGGWQFRSSKQGEAPQYTTISNPLILVFR